MLILIIFIKWIIFRKVFMYFKICIHLMQLSYISTSICKYHLKMSKKSKRDILLKCYFSFKLTLYISLYLRRAKLGLLRCYFSFGSNWAFCHVKEDYKKSGLIKIVRIVRSWIIVAILLKIFKRSRSFWIGKIINLYERMI